ncbi:beta-ketoacyl-[acyl-carrier-protein] synthase II [Mucilaginibacter conchicola]|uniref:3-oxoacyl-[acyl-carrier-protein] synthase 2 n=1 Tax=Mucilaginibacter conchicola TaxID=2303333 RepID=A0A372P0B9_9SPHI|nr:beta-ketoacyl-ACP synthase II [Mucilaginibacter conchicola]RFZ95800.1 beta-ketoacyl-[acyl-carrier-protein] synthase II [Mucilaginibacter conchicola]
MKRVVITGLGVISPAGNDIKNFWDNIVNGRSNAAAITHFNAEYFKTHFACEVKGFNPADVLDRNEVKRSDLYTQYALAAAKQAVEDSGFDITTVDPFDIGVILGSAQGGFITFEEQMRGYAATDHTPHFNPFFIPKTLVNMASGLISIKYGFMGINFSTASACATANTSIMDALNYIRWGKAKIIVTGGADAPISEGSIGGYNALKALSTRNDSPEAASRPFDVERDGFVMGEGAGVLVLEEYEHAKARGAKIYAEVAGAAMTSDAYHITATHPEGKGAIRGMKLALEDGGLNADSVNYVNAHATSTPVGDLSESKAIHAVFADNKNFAISATKSMTGHLLGAAGAIEAIISIKAIQDNIIPPTINTHTIDPEIPADLHIVTKEAIDKQVNVALSNTFGFGGHNGIAVFKKV